MFLVHRCDLKPHHLACGMVLNLADIVVMNEVGLFLCIIVYCDNDAQKRSPPCFIDDRIVPKVHQHTIEAIEL